MHDSVIEILSGYLRQTNSCSGQSAYKAIDEIISVLAEEVPLVKAKRGIVARPYNRAYDEVYNDQLRYLGKVIELKIAELEGVEIKKDKKIKELSSKLDELTEEKHKLEEKNKSLRSELSELEEKYNKAVRELAEKNKGAN